MYFARCRCDIDLRGVLVEKIEIFVEIGDIVSEVDLGLLKVLLHVCIFHNTIFSVCLFYILMEHNVLVVSASD